MRKILPLKRNHRFRWGLHLFTLLAFSLIFTGAWSQVVRTNSTGLCLTNSSSSQTVDFTGALGGQPIDSAVVTINFDMDFNACAGGSGFALQDEVGMAITNGVTGTRQVLVVESQNNIGMSGFTQSTWNGFTEVQNVTLVFTGNAAANINSISDVGTLNGTTASFDGEKTMSAFNGQMAEGIWTLEFQESVSSNFLNVISWSVTLYPPSGCTPGNFASFSGPQTVCPGDSASFNTSTSGTIDSLQWQVSTNGGTTWSNLSNGSPYSGVTTNNLLVFPTTAGMSGNLYRNIAYACGGIADSTGGGLLTSNDNTAPSITCPSNSTVFLDGSCAASLADFTGSATVSDNCDNNPTVTQSPASGTTLSGTGTTNVTLLAQDASGNLDSCSFTVTAQDSTPPVITCPGTQTESLDTICQFFLADYTGMATSSDNCSGSPSVTQFPGAGTQINGTSSVNITLTANDGNGNTSQCVFTVLTVDDTPPTLSCRGNDTISLDNSCSANVPNYIAMLTASDNCGVSTVTQSPLPGTGLGSPGTNPVLIIATDGAGNSDSCSFAIITIDTIAPEFVGGGSPAMAALNPVADATLNQSFTNNNMGGHVNFHAGLTNASQKRRGLVKFDIAGSIPPGVNIDSVNLALTVPSGNIAGSSQFGLHKALLDWGEGNKSGNNGAVATPGESTWNSAMSGAVNWSTPGGIAGVDFTGAPSALTTVSGLATYHWTGMDSDVQDWLDNPAGNFGWFLISQSETVIGTARRFGSRASATPPVLNVYYSGGGFCGSTDTIFANGSCNGIIPDYSSVATYADACDPSPVFTQSPAAGSSIASTGGSVTLTVTDASGNFSTCVINIEVADTSAPTVSCPAPDTVMASSNCDATLQDYTGMLSITDNCDTSFVVMQMPAAGATLSQGSNTITFTATDQSGNTGTCSFDVVVADMTPPTIGGFSSVTLSPMMDATLNESNPDNNMGAHNRILVGTNNGGQKRRGVIKFDVAGNVPAGAVIDSVKLSMTVSDGNVANPSFFAINRLLTDWGEGNKTGSNGQPATSGEVTWNNRMHPSTAWGTPGGQFNVDVFPGSSSAVSVSGLGTYVWQGMAFDVQQWLNTPTSNNGWWIQSLSESTNGSARRFNSREGATPPTLEIFFTAPSVCGANDTLYADTACAAMVPDYSGSIQISDNCDSSPVYSQSPAAGSMMAPGSSTVTLFATDASGNVDSCSVNLTVVDTTSPTAVCQDITTFLDASGNSTISPADVDGGSLDACGPVTLALSDTTFTCSDSVEIVTLTVTDGSGNTSNCAANVTVSDTVRPNVVCQNVTIFLDTAGTAMVSTGDLDNGSSDACGILTIALGGSGMYTCADSIETLTLVVTDVNGNVDSCLSTITVLDTISPAAVCQSDTVYLDTAGTAMLTAGNYEAGSTDNCGVTGISVSPAMVGCADLGSASVVFTATDASGNSGNCNTSVTVIDTIAPTAVCQDVTVDLNASGMFVLNPIQVDGASTDNCAITSRSLSVDTVFCSDIPSITTMLTVQDTSGNSSSCMATVTVRDFSAPTAICTTATVSIGPSGTLTLDPQLIDGGSTDNCGVDSLLTFPSTFNCSNVGSTVNVSLLVFDEAGNSAGCQTQLTILDTVPPVAVCQDVTVQLDNLGLGNVQPSAVDNGTTDNCGTPTFSLNMQFFDCSHIGSNTVTLTATDNNNNSDSCTAVVTVQDTLPPTASCQDVTVQLDAAGQGTLSGSDLDNGSTDNCSVDSLISSVTSFSCIDLGVQQVMLTTIDAGGNQDSCMSNVTVEDTIAPTAICQDVTVFLDAVGNGSVTLADIDGGTGDNCSLDTLYADEFTFICADTGTYTSTLTAVDGSGNSSTCVSNIAVFDTLAVNASFTFATFQDSVVFTDGSTGRVNDWAWDFGDGNSSSLQNPTHVYDTAGNYVVCLTVNPADSCPVTVCDTVTILPDGVEAGLEGFFGVEIYPNPFRNVTTIRFNTDQSLEAGIRVLDLTGRAVRDLGTQVWNVGTHEIQWNGRTNGGEQVSSGLYFIEISGRIRGNGTPFRVIRKVQVAR